MMNGSGGMAAGSSGRELPVETVLLTVSEAARRLSLGRATAYQLVQRGELPVVRIGRAVRVPARALEAWIVARTTGGEGTDESDSSGWPSRRVSG